MIKRGAFSAPVKTDRVFCFVRLKAEPSHDEHELRNMKEKEVNLELPAEQIYRIRAVDDEGHLASFGRFYQTRFEKLVESFVQENPQVKHETVLEDVLRHFDFIKSNYLTELSTSSQKIMKSLSDYVLEGELNGRPVIVTGPSGSGKTTYCATLASNLELQFKTQKCLGNAESDEIGIVTRFIGIDGKCFYLRNLLKSLCAHFNFFYRHHLLSDTQNDKFSAVPSKLNDLKSYFKRFMSDENQLLRRFKLVVILDSIESLAPQDHALRLDWLPRDISANARFILTVSSTNKPILTNLRLLYSDKARFTWLSRIEHDQAQLMLRVLYFLRIFNQLFNLT